MVNIRPRRLMTIARRNQVAKAIKSYVVGLVIESGNTMSAVREKVRTQKGKSNLTPAICEDWATGLGFQTLDIELMFTDADILQFFIKALNIKVDGQTDVCLFSYVGPAYTYDLQEVVDFYWYTVGRVLYWC